MYSIIHTSQLVRVLFLSNSEIFDIFAWHLWTVLVNKWFLEITTCSPEVSVIFFFLCIRKIKIKHRTAWNIRNNTGIPTSIPRQIRVISTTRIPDQRDSICNVSVNPHYLTWRVTSSFYREFSAGRKVKTWQTSWFFSHNKPFLCPCHLL